MLETLEKDFNKQIASYEVKHGKFQTLNDQLKAEVTEQELRFVQLRDEQAQESDRYTLELLQAQLAGLETESSAIDEENKALEDNI